MSTISTYRTQSIRYREPSVYYRGGVATTSITYLEQPSRDGITIRIYDISGILVNQFSTNCGISKIIDWKFELTDTGCGAFDLTLDQDYSLDDEYQVDFHLNNDPRPWYSGWIQVQDSPGKTAYTHKISGFGFFSMAEDVLVTETYTATTRIRVVADGLARILERDSGRRIIYDAGLIENSSYQITGKLKFLRTPFKDAMKQVCELAGGFEWGVNENRKFFFRKTRSEVDAISHLWAGKHMSTLVSDADGRKILNSLYIKLGKVRTDLSPGHALFGTNYMDLPIENAASIAALGRKRMGVYSASSMLSPTDALRGAAIDLAKKSVKTQKARITGVEFTGEKITSQGSARITGKDGSELTLPKKKVTYTGNPWGIGIDIELGEYDNTPGTLLATIQRAAAEESLNRQNSQNQIA